MKKKSHKYHEYLKRRQRLIEKQRSKEKNRKIAPNLPLLESEFRKEDEEKDSTVYFVPDDFSIYRNSDIVITFFHDVRTYILKPPINKNIHFNFSEVKHLTVDALMYLLAIIKNLDPTHKYVRKYSGGMPSNEEAKELFVNSGFLRYVRSKIKRLEHKSNCVQIATNSVVKRTVAKNIVEFIRKNDSNVDQSTTSAIYEMIIELETNTHDHASKMSDNDIEKLDWLAYAEDAGDFFRFTFLDTGIGICRTIKRNWFEGLDKKRSDPTYLMDALKGELPSSTKMKNRGNGLPTILGYAVSGLIERFTIITNQAYCYYNPESNDIVSRPINKSIWGTVYYWELSKNKQPRKRVENNAY